MKLNFPHAPFKGDKIKGMDLLVNHLWPGDSTGTIVPSTTSTTPHQHRDYANPPDRRTSYIPADFMLFLGDFVYVDVPYYFGGDLNAYRRNYQSPSPRRVYERLRGLQVFAFYLLLIPKSAIFFTYDDHEFVNNCAGPSRDHGPCMGGSRAFLEYNARAKHRSTLEVEAANRSTLGIARLGTFLRRLSEVRPALRTNRFTLRTHDAAVDSWAACTAAKTSILDTIATVPDVIILSGDRHEFALVEFNHPGSTGHRVFEISTNPLSMCISTVMLTPYST
ncbi:hypothetical protein BDM02DRAFT_3118064 [Thelephora ganbajun]|uniref:Uncharacterized protein n=1 Tax=Thelephora ganbajun TaxID=370292 RepID=A0ACB6ZC37_THEGA|nr:hypothetical protein BDM02DRAFT_3118064 [Thelephora ganbajun]